MAAAASPSHRLAARRADKRSVIRRTRPIDSGGIRCALPPYISKRGSTLLVKAGRIFPQQLLLRRRVEALPGEDVVDRLGKLAFRVRVVRGVHKHVVTE